MSDFSRFIVIIFCGFSASFMFYFFTCFPSFSPSSRRRAFKFSYIIMIPTVLLAFLVSHMVEHVFNFLDFFVNL